MMIRMFIMLGCLTVLGCANSILSGRLDRHAGSRDLIFMVHWIGSETKNVQPVVLGTKVGVSGMRKCEDEHRGEPDYPFGLFNEVSLVEESVAECIFHTAQRSQSFHFRSAKTSELIAQFSPKRGYADVKQGYAVFLFFGNEMFYDFLGFDERRIKALSEFKKCLNAKDAAQLQLLIPNSGVKIDRLRSF